MIAYSSSLWPYREQSLPEGLYDSSYLLFSRRTQSCNLSLGWQARATAMSGGRRGVRRGSLAVCEVKSEACSGSVDALIKALGPRLWPQHSATLADAPCHLARAAA